MTAVLSPRDVADMEPHFLLMTAEAWEKPADAVHQKESEYRAKVLSPLDGGAWTGDDAAKALTMLRYFTDDLQAVQAEAGAGAGILREAHGQLLAAKNTMKAPYDEAYREGLTINPDGTVSWGASETENVAAHKQALDHDLATRIATGCRHAADADLLADRMLRDNTDNGPDQDFTKSDINGKAANQQFETYWTTRGPIDRVVTDYADRNGAAYDDINTTVNGAFENGVRSPLLRNP